MLKLVLEKVIRELQASEGGIQVDQSRIPVLRFSDDLFILGESLMDVSNSTKILSSEAKKIEIHRLVMIKPK